MFVRVRSPLFIFHVLAALVAGLCMGLRWDIWQGRESFMRTDAFRVVDQLSLIGLWLGLAAMVVLGLMELALHRGWDPPFFRIRLYGATVLHVDSPSGFRTNCTVTVRHPDGEDHLYQAEPDEAAGLKVGDVVRLDVFGEHVVGYRVLERPEALSMEVSSTHDAVRALRRTRLHGNWTARLFMMAGFPVSAALIGANLLPLIYREDVVFVGRRRRFSGRLVTLMGDEALWINLVWVVPAAVALVAFAWFWLRGWDAEDLQYHLTDSDDWGYRRWRTF